MANQTKYIFYMLVLLMTLLIVAGMSYMLVDTPANSTAAQLNQQYQQHIDNATPDQVNSYYYQMGMGYQIKPLHPLEDEPLSIATVTNVGKQLVTQANALHGDDGLPLSLHSQAFDKVYDNFVLVKYVSTSDFCNLKPSNTNDDDCLHITQATPKQLRRAIKDNQPRLTHYQNFLTLPPAVTISLPSFHAPVANWQILRQGQKTANVQYLLLAKSGQVQTALEQLLQDFAILRSHFAHSDSSIGKMVMRSMLDEQLRMMALIKTQYDPKQQLQINPIKPITLSEASLKPIYLYELMSQQNLLNSIAREDMKWWQNVWQRMNFKPQQTINITADYYQKLIDDDDISASAFAAAQQNKGCQPQTTLPLTGFGINNHFGKVLANMALPEYSQYKQKIWSLNNLINMTNYVLSSGNTALQNTYAPTITTVTKTKDTICMAEPKKCRNYEIKQENVCLLLHT